MIETIIFYVFAISTVITATAVVTVKNPVHAVLANYQHLQYSGTNFETVPIPVASMFGSILASSQAKCWVSLGAANVAMARGGFVDREEAATANEAAPPKLCPMSAPTGPISERANSIAARRSAMLVVKLVCEKSPSLPPNPVMSNRSTAIPNSASPREMRTIALRSLLQVKQ